MTDINESTPPRAPRRADARRNEQTLLDAAAALFVTSGVEVPVRDIAVRAGVGTGTIYRHFPTTGTSRPAPTSSSLSTGTR